MCTFYGLVELFTVQFHPQESAAVTVKQLDSTIEWVENETPGLTVPDVVFIVRWDQ